MALPFPGLNLGCLGLRFTFESDFGNLDTAKSSPGTLLHKQHLPESSSNLCQESNFLSLTTLNGPTTSTHTKRKLGFLHWKNMVLPHSLQMKCTCLPISGEWTHPQPCPFPTVIRRWRARGLVSWFKAEGARLDSALALLFLQKGCGLWTQSCCDFVPQN